MCPPLSSSCRVFRRWRARWLAVLLGLGLSMVFSSPADGLQAASWDDWLTISEGQETALGKELAQQVRAKSQCSTIPSP